MMTLLAATRFIPRDPALVEMMNKRPLEHRRAAKLEYFGKELK